MTDAVTEETSDLTLALEVSPGLSQEGKPATMAMMRPPIDTSSTSDSGRVVNVQGGNHNLNMNADASPNHKKKGSVQVKLELGHKAITRKKPTPEGFTHDWTMFVRGPEGSNIQHFVDRVIFYLHESFPKPKRVVKEPPYQINESGYAGFNLPIEIYFKNKDDPKKINFSYDLFLHTPHSPPVNHVRCEKLTFQNPSEEFRRKLVKAGGMALLAPADQPQPSGSQSSITQGASPSLTTQPHTPESKYADLFGEKKSEKKHKSTSKEKSGGRSKSSSSSQGSSVSPLSGSLMGTPPAAISPPTTPSKEQPKPHTGGSGSKHKDKTGKRPAESATASPVESSKKKRKDNGDNSSRDREEKREKEKRDQEREKEQQREEKEKKEKEKKEKKERKGSSKESKSKHKSSKKDVTKPPKKGTSPRGAASKSSPRVASPRVPSPRVPSPRVPSPRAPSPPPPEISRSVPEVRTLAAKKAPPSTLEDLGLGGTDMYGFDDGLDMNMDIPADLMAAVCSPASTLSFSSMKGQGGEGGGGGPLRELFAEMDDDDVPLSPLPLTSDSPPHSLTQSQPSANPTKEPPALSVEPPPKDPSPPQPDPKPAPGKAKKRGKESRRSRVERHAKEASKENKDSSKDTSSISSVTKTSAKDAIAKDLFRDYQDGKEAEDKAAQSKPTAPPNNDTSDNTQQQQQQPSMVAPNGETLSVLLELQTRLMRMTDRDLVQRVVNVIEETGMYKISDATFDFDLCSLDIHTVKKLQVCLEMVC